MKPLDAVYYLIIFSVVIIFALMVLLPLRSFVVVFIQPQLQAGDEQDGRVTITESGDV